jgi:hypothetical protein
MHITATAATKMIATKSVSSAASVCCTAMNLHNAIVLPNPSTV